MLTVGAYEAKTKLSELLDRVLKGEEITIAKHGTPVAKLVPVEQGASRDVGDVILELLSFRQGRSLKGLSLREAREEGRR